MKARPVKIVMGEGYVQCPIAEATHVTINMPGPTGILTLPIILRGSRKDTGCWSWNGDTEKPTLKPSVKTEGHLDPVTWEPKKWVCHSWVNDGQAQFLRDSTHELTGQTVDLLDLEDKSVPV